MPASNYTPIYLYASGSAGVKPAAGNPGIANTSKGSEVALNYADGILYYANSSGTVTALASASATAGQFSSITDTGLTTAGIVTNTSGGVLGTTTSPTLTALTINNGSSGGAITLNSVSGLPLAITALGSGINSYFNFGYPIINTSAKTSTFSGNLTVTNNATIAGVIFNSANNIPVSSPNTATSGSDGGWQTWTPSVNGLTGATFQTTLGRYLIIGSIAFVQLNISWLNNTVANSITITGLPITPSTLSGFGGTVMNGIVGAAGTTSPSSVYYLTCGTGSSTIYVVSATGNVSSNATFAIGGGAFSGMFAFSLT